MGLLTAILNWNFRRQILYFKFQRSEVLLNGCEFVCKKKRFQSVQYTHLLVALLT